MNNDNNHKIDISSNMIIMITDSLLNKKLNENNKSLKTHSAGLKTIYIFNDFVKNWNNEGEDDDDNFRNGVMKYAVGLANDINSNINMTKYYLNVTNEASPEYYACEKKLIDDNQSYALLFVLLSAWGDFYRNNPSEDYKVVVDDFNVFYETLHMLFDFTLSSMNLTDEHLSIIKELIESFL